MSAAGRDLDVRIARDVIGMKPCHFMITGRYSAWATVWECRCKTFGKCYPENKDAVDHSHSPLAKYSERLEAAWEVLVSPSSNFKQVRGLSSRSGEDFRLCRGYPDFDVYWLEYMTPAGLRKGPEAKTPALAICLAALEAVS